MKLVLKAPGFMLLKLRYDGPLSNFACNFILRRYRKGKKTGPQRVWPTYGLDMPDKRPKLVPSAASVEKAFMKKAVADIRVGRCRLTVSKLELKARLVSALQTTVSKLELKARLVSALETKM
jgi:hypothetical protein